MKIFISYSSSEFNKVIEICKVLEKNGFDCWMAPQSIPAGSDYGAEIPTAIKNSDAFLLVLSHASQESIWVPKELDLAITDRKIIIPFHIDDSDITEPFNFRLTNIQRIETFNKVSEGYRRLIEKLRSAESSIGEKKISILGKVTQQKSEENILAVDAERGVNNDPINSPSTLSPKGFVQFVENFLNVFLDVLKNGDGFWGIIARAVVSIIFVIGVIIFARYITELGDSDPPIGELSIRSPEGSEKSEFELDVKVRLAGTHNEFVESIDAEVGDRVEYQIQFTNSAANDIQENVIIRDVLPENMFYVANTTYLYNSNHKDGEQITSDGDLFGDGINIGGYKPNVSGWVRFTAEVTDKSLEEGDNILVNWAQGMVKATIHQDHAKTMVQKP